MSGGRRMKKKNDDRKELLIRYRIDDDGKVSFIDPCVDEIPAMLFGSVMEKISEAQKEWNESIKTKKGRS